MVWTVTPGDRVRVVRDPGKTYDCRLPRAFCGTVVQVTPRLLVVDAGPYRAAVAAWEVIAGYAEVTREQGATATGEGDCTRPPAPPGKGALRRPCRPPLPSGRGAGGGVAEGAGRG